MTLDAKRKKLNVRVGAWQSPKNRKAGWTGLSRLGESVQLFGSLSSPQRPNPYCEAFYRYEERCQCNGSNISILNGL